MLFDRLKSILSEIWNLVSCVIKQRMVVIHDPDSVISLARNLRLRGCNVMYFLSIYSTTIQGSKLSSFLFKTVFELKRFLLLNLKPQ